MIGWSRSISATNPRWSPTSEREIREALEGGLLEETHCLDLKRELARGKAKNREHARDLASFAVAWHSVADKQIGREPALVVETKADEGVVRAFAPITEAIEPEELLPERLYRLRMIDADDERPVDVQVFLDLGEIGGLLWEQDVRALLRMAASPHPALPEVLAGGYLTDMETTAAGVEGMAFVATRGSRRCAGPQEVKRFRVKPLDGLRKFRSLAEGVAELQHLGIAHRDISPSSLDVSRDGTLRQT